jgi:hypothetical protein
MKKKQGNAGPSRSWSFAHLLGRGGLDTGGGDDSEKRDGESDEDYAKRMDEEERKQREDESDEEYAKRMEELDKDKDGDDDDEAEGEDVVGDKDADDESDKEKAARRNERARCAAIFASEAAAARPDVAAHLAFETDMSAKAAVKMLSTFAAGPAPARTSLASRMSTVKQVNTGTGRAAAPGGAAAVAALILAAGKKRRGE